MKIKYVSLSFLFITQSVFADLMCEDGTDYTAIYEPNYYTCTVGQYLPANTDGCVSCPTGFNCPGGTFVFSPESFNGLNFESIPNNTINNACANNFPNFLKAIYEPNVHTCLPGYYLPANTDGCTICPSGKSCYGGTFTFNEYADQGIVSACPNGYFAPLDSPETCFPHILHVGDNMLFLKSTKQTTPSLNVGLSNGEVFYANMVTTPIKMNKDSTHELRAIYEGVDYWICDDTICPNAE